MTYCPHPSIVIDGLYAVKGSPIATAWTCRECSTSGGTLWHLATPEQREEAERIYKTGKRSDG